MEKYELYREHHEAKTLTIFFPSLYEEYFALWPPTPTAEEIEAEQGNVAVATVIAQKAEEAVRGFEFTG